MLPQDIRLKSLKPVLPHLNKERVVADVIKLSFGDEDITLHYQVGLKCNHMYPYKRETD